MTRITLIRHGQARLSTYAALDPTAPSLCDQGRRQAAILGAFLAERGLDELWASDMPRALETAAVIAEETGLGVERCEALRESYPELPPDHPSYKPELAPAYQFTKEAADQIRERFYRFQGEERRIALVSHGNTIRYLLATAMGCPLQWLNFTIMKHCSCSTLIVHSKGRIQLDQYNDCHRLPEEMRTVENLDDRSESS